MQKIKTIFRYLLYGSILFVIYYLYQFDFLSLEHLSINWQTLILAVILLWAGFIVSTQSWRRALIVHGINISRSEAIYSHGISVFAKYMPGKIWVILGRASIISEKKGGLLVLSSVSLKEQLVYLFLGLLCSSVLIFYVPFNWLASFAIIGSVMGLGLFLFVKPIHDFALGMLFKLIKKEFTVPYIKFKNAALLSQTILLYWALWSLGFYLLVISIAPQASAMAILAFPLSVSYGLIAVIVPGGIGVREGIIVFILHSLGIDLQTATTISLIQRLWFISGEVFMFLTAMISRKATL